VYHGVCLFGSENATYSVELDVTDSCSESSVASKIGEFSSEPLQGKTFSYQGFRLSFDKKIILKKTTIYVMRAKISGLPSLRGVSSVQCSRVTFTFMKSNYSKNGTDSFKGQFPELLFSVSKQ